MRRESRTRRHLPQKRPQTKKQKQKKIAIPLPRMRDEALEARVAEAMQGFAVPVHPSDVAARTGFAEGIVQQMLLALAHEGQVAFTRQGLFATPQAMGYKVCRVQKIQRGGAYLIADGGAEWRVGEEALGGAMHGDTVWALPKRVGEVTVIRVVNRANETIVGTVRRQGRKAYLEPKDRRLPEQVPLTGAADDVIEGELVAVRVVRWPDEGGLQAEIAERLGRSGDVQSEMSAILHGFGLKPGFPEEVLREAAAAAAQDIAPEISNRLDLRGERVFTIDGADAKDFDDAVSIERLDDGWLLGVHIADVSFYVRQGTALDREAYARGTSVYLPGRVLPMLPEALSNGSCSLNPDVDRLTMSALLYIDANGDVTRYHLQRSVIRSCARLVYEDVNRLLDSGEAVSERYAMLEDDLREMARLSSVIRGRRKARGSVDFELEEAQIDVGADGEPTDIRARERGVSHKMIEDFMLLANEIVARHAKAHQLPFLYRVHEAPDPEKLESFALFLGGLGLRLPGELDAVTPMMLQKLLISTEDRPEYPVIARLLLRSMQKAKYDPRPLGHFGLAAKDYCHFTSPIRRYPDLFIHRVLALTFAQGDEAADGMRQAAEGAAVQSSEREKNAMEAEREADRMMMARYMSGHLGETYDAVITGVVEWGFFATLPNTVEGLVHVRTLNDYFSFSERSQSLIGERSGVRYRIGQSVRVRVESVDTQMYQINFALEDE